MRAKAKKFFLFFFILLFSTFFSNQGLAGPGDYSLRITTGPSFQLNDWHDQIRVGSEFSYDLGYSMGVGMLGLLGFNFKEEFRFQLIPSFKYDLVYLGPASIFGVAGCGYGRFNSHNTFDLRMGLGILLPLGDMYEVNSDVNLFVSPAGISGTPMTLDWLISFGRRFH